MNSEEFFKSEAKIFTKKSIGLATFFGGPVVTGYMISQNFKAFGEIDKAKIAFKHGIFGSILFFSILLAIPERYMELLPSSISNSIFPAIYTAIGIWWMEKVQGKLIQNHLDQGGGSYSGWKSTQVGFVGLFITLIFLILLSILTTALSPELEGKKIDSITNKNRVYYENIDSVEVVSIIDTLGADKFFDQNYNFYFKIEGKEKGYKFLFPVTEDYWSSPELLGYYAAYKSFLERSFPTKDIQFVLFQEGFAGRVYKDITYEDTVPLWWMQKPSKLESEKEIAERLIAYLAFWECFFQYGIDNDLDEMSWPSIPNVINFASNGIALTRFNDITDEWKDTYFDKASTLRAYNMLRESFYSAEWEENALIFKSYVKILADLKENVNIIQKEADNNISPSNEDAFDSFFNNATSTNMAFVSMKKEKINEDVTLEILKEDIVHYVIGKKYKIKFKLFIKNEKYITSKSNNEKLEDDNFTSNTSNGYFNFSDDNEFKLSDKISSISTSIKNGITEKSATFTYSILFDNPGNHKVTIMLNDKLKDKKISFYFNIENSTTIAKFNSDINKIIEFVKLAKSPDVVSEILSDPMEKIVGGNNKTTILKYAFFGKTLNLYVLNNQIIDYVISGEEYDYSNENVSKAEKKLIRP